MGKLGVYKLIALLALSLILTNNSAFANMPFEPQGSSSGRVNAADDSDHYLMRWDVNSQANFENQSSVELVVGISSKTNSFAGVSRIVKEKGGEIVDTVSIGKSSAIVVNITSKSASSLAGELRASGFSNYVEPNILFTVDSVPNDAYWSSQWGPKKIQADYAWDKTAGNQSILVAIIDTGIDYNHPDLKSNYVSLGYDWGNRDSDPRDDNGHGTHCAGIVAAVTNNSIGIAGLAQVRIMAEKALDADGSGYSSNLAKAIRHAVDQGAQIISNSWGSDERSSVVYEAINYANEHGVLVIVAAGNTGENELQYPSAYDNVVAVTATDDSDAVASFSTYGDWVDVAAPGVSIYSTMPTYYVTMNSKGYSRNYAYISGTSMACPHAAGVAALIWSQYPSMTANLVRYQLETTCDDLGVVGFDIYYGNGRINARNAVEQTVLEHDLVALNWTTPSTFIKTGIPVAFNFTAFNRGLRNEFNVRIELSANGSLVNSTTVASLASGASALVSLSWTPSTAGLYNVTFAIVPVSGETLIENNKISQNLNVVTPPNEANFTLLATDPDEGAGMGLKAGYSQLQSGIAFFKLEFYRPWSKVKTDIDASVLIDVDQNSRTGLSDGYYKGQKCNIGVDYMVIVGDEGPAVWKWNETLGFFDVENTLPIVYLDAQDNSNVFVVGVYLSDLGSNGFFDCAFCDAWSDWDWMPNTGYVPFSQGRGQQHELAVTLQIPKGLQLGEGTLVNATVYNFGQGSEADVKLYLLINDALFSSETVSNLPSGSSHQLSYSWSPTVEGLYNVTVFATPVSTEELTQNNVKSRLVSVSDKIALISDRSELWDITPILDSLMINYETYDNNTLYYYTENLTLLQSYSTVIFYNFQRAITSSEELALNAYLASGGNLLVTGHDSLGFPNDWRMANVVRSSTVGDNYYQSDLYVQNGSHPIMSGPYGSFPVGYHISGLYSDNDAARADTSKNATTIARLANNYDKIIVTQDIPGKVVYWNGDGTEDWRLNVDCKAMLKNLMVWFLDRNPPSTADDYDGLWHNADFTITLTVNEPFGVAQTYYRINSGALNSVGANGYPRITAEGSNNTLEYWSVDLIGNEEFPHKVLSQIKLDKTAPTAKIKDTEVVSSALSVNFDGSESSDNFGIANYTWNFGDGNQAQGASVAHTYSQFGTYTVTLTVQDLAGNNATTTAQITLRMQTSPQQTATPQPSPTATATPAPAPTPSLAPTKNSTSIQVMAADGTIVNLALSGNITAAQVSGARITLDQAASTAVLSFALTGEAGTVGFGNVTIPKNLLYAGVMPMVYVDDESVESQGYTQDANNYYVWFTVHFSTRQVSIVFMVQSSAEEFPWLFLLVPLVVVLLVVGGVLAQKRRRNAAGQ